MMSLTKNLFFQSWRYVLDKINQLWMNLLCFPFCVSKLIENNPK